MCVNKCNNTPQLIPLMQGTHNATNSGPRVKLKVFHTTIQQPVTGCTALSIKTSSVFHLHAARCLTKKCNKETIIAGFVDANLDKQRPVTTSRYNNDSRKRRK